MRRTVNQALKNIEPLLSLVSPASTVARPAYSPTTPPTLGTSTLMVERTAVCLICHGPGKVADIKAIHAN